jgi:hypothetical protein
MATIAIISLILSAAGLIAGTVGSARANKKYENYLRDRQRKADTWYDREYNTNILDTDEGKATMQLLRNRLKEQTQAQGQANAIRGASDEAALASVTEGQKVYADAGLSLAARGQERKDNIQNIYDTKDMNLAGLKAQNLLDKRQNWSNLISNSGNLLSSSLAVGAGNTGTDGLNKKTPLVYNPLTYQQRREYLSDDIFKNASKLLGQVKVQ